MSLQTGVVLKGPPFQFQLLLNVPLILSIDSICPISSVFLLISLVPSGILSARQLSGPLPAGLFCSSQVLQTM